MNWEGRSKGNKNRNTHITIRILKLRTSSLPRHKLNAFYDESARMCQDSSVQSKTASAWYRTQRPFYENISESQDTAVVKRRNFHKSTEKFTNLWNTTRSTIMKVFTWLFLLAVALTVATPLGIMAAAENTTKVAPELEFLHYIDKLKHLDRINWVMEAIPKPETVAGHMYRVAVMLAFMVDDPSIDMNRCIRMALAHDMGESIIGDLPTHGTDGAAKFVIELAAINKIASLIPKAKGDDLRTLFLEYEERTTPEARLVKDADKFDLLLQAYEYEQSEKRPFALQEFFDGAKKRFTTNHPQIQAMVEKLYEARDAQVPYEQD